MPDPIREQSFGWPSSPTASTFEPRHTCARLAQGMRRALETVFEGSVVTRQLLVETTVMRLGMVGDQVVGLGQLGPWITLAEDCFHGETGSRPT